VILPADRRNWPKWAEEAYQERAAIMAVLGHLPIWLAEKNAELDVRKTAELERDEIWQHTT
jgi:hypothetical protein